MTILTERALAEKLNLPYWTVRRMRLEEKMPFFKIGRRFFYEYENVCGWIRDKQSATSKNNHAVESIPQYGKIRQII